MLIDQYYNLNDGKVSFTRQQGSDLAKQIADDFNPIHNVDSKRFCVPGDLLFSLVLARYGVTKHMRFSFNGMVTEDVELLAPEDGPEMIVVDDNDKNYLSIEHTGDNSRDSELIDNLTRSYVTFSGHTFPHILVPLLKEQGVMINLGRPMVMYQSMLIDLERLDLTDIQLELDKEKTVVEVNGKRGNICLAFFLKSGDTIIGRGEKHMIASGLQPYDQQGVDQIVSDYVSWKRDYKG